MKTLETKRLILRQWTINDAADLFDYAKSPVVGPMAGWKPHESVNESLEIINRFIEGDETWAIYHREDKKVIGSVGLHPDEKRNTDKKAVAMLGYVLSENYWGKGIVAEACQEVLKFSFLEKGLEIISLFHYPFNLQSKRVAEKLGFKYEGILRKASVIYDGKVYDDVCYSLSREEWGKSELQEKDCTQNKNPAGSVSFRNYRILSDYPKVSSFLRKNYRFPDINGYL